MYSMIEAPEPPHHHHQKTALPWFDFILPLAILAISIAGLLTSLQSERSMRALVEQNSRLVSAQSTPLLMLDSHNGEGTRLILGMNLSNVGTGPAQIFWFHLADVQGADYTGAAVEDRVRKLDPNQRVGTQYIASTLMRSGDERIVFRWPKPPAHSPAAAEWDKLNAIRPHLKASACYCSIFEECRITDFGLSRPRLVPSCDQPAAQPR